MFHKVRERLGSASLAVAIVALIVALRAAYAATATNSAKSQPRTDQSPGHRLDQGQFEGWPSRIAGSSRPGRRSGTKETREPQEAKATPGPEGDTGTSVNLTPIAVGAGKCSGRGGATLKENASPGAEKDICTGEKGTQGDKGDPSDPVEHRWRSSSR